MFRGIAEWDPTCATRPPAPYVWTCRPVGPGNYDVRLTDQGVVLDPAVVSIAPG